ncbi:MAG TPA: S24/S26 family peptidase [Haliangiales bacterium]|nr:S24/S26 family peptidase [Haliangiales bacterium]
MEPTLPVGARVRVIPCADPRPGDVVVIHTRSGLVVHRLWARAPGLLVHGGERGRPGLARTRDLVGRADVARRPIAPPGRALAMLRAALLYCEKWLPWRSRVAPPAKRRSAPFSASKTTSPG